MDDRFFHHGGSLKPDSPSYIQRPADTELYEHIKAGDFCYVLTTRQMGKSSLMARTAARLKNEGCLTAIIDLTSIGGQEQNTDTRSWYYGILHQITREINKQLKQARQPTLTFKDWWDANSELSSIQRFSEYFEDVLLAHTDKPITIFFDEIDSTITLPFTDDFFAAIRAFYNKRASDDDYQRLGFVLLGVATPADLINDTRRTPFNIGQAITLDDFTLEELKTLRDGFACDTETADTLLARIHHWTDGHPYLSQKLASLVQHGTLTPKDTINNIVSTHFLHPRATQNETNLKFVDNRIMRNKKSRLAMLKLYRQLYHDRMIEDKPLSLANNELKLSGLVKLNRNNQIKIRNLLYQEVFNENWLKKGLRKEYTILRSLSLTISTVALSLYIWTNYILPTPYVNKILSYKYSNQASALEKNNSYLAYKELSELPFQRKKANSLSAHLFFILNITDTIPERIMQIENHHTELSFFDFELPEIIITDTIKNFIFDRKDIKDVKREILRASPPKANLHKFFLKNLVSLKENDSIELRRRISQFTNINGEIKNLNQKAIYTNRTINKDNEAKIQIKTNNMALYKLTKGEIGLSLNKEGLRKYKALYFLYLSDIAILNSEFSNGETLCLDENCNEVKVTYTDAPDSPSEIIYFDARNYPPIEGDPDELLKEWSEKLGIDPDTL